MQSPDQVSGQRGGLQTGSAAQHSHQQHNRRLLHLETTHQHSTLGLHTLGPSSLMAQRASLQMQITAKTERAAGITDGCVPFRETSTG